MPGLEDLAGGDRDAWIDQNQPAGGQGRQAVRQEHYERGRGQAMNIDLKQSFSDLGAQFEGLQGRHPGLWPLAPRGGATAAADVEARQIAETVKASIPRGAIDPERMPEW